MPSDSSKIRETWRPVIGFEGVYEVSDQGGVRSLDRVVEMTVAHRNQYGTRTQKKRVRRRHRGQVLYAAIGSHGYPMVSLHKDRKPYKRLVHVLVLEAFVGPRPRGAQCRHLNNVRSDARLSNLRWGTPSENQRDRVKAGTSNRGERNPHALLSCDDARLIRKAPKAARKELAARFGVSVSTIRAVQERRNWAWLDAED